MMALKALGASQKRLLKDKSVIFLFMHGGPSQFETFDPKMDAPSEIRSVTGEIKTKIPASPSAARLSGWRSWRTSSASCAPS
jgi:hypothetical protein